MTLVNGSCAHCCSRATSCDWPSRMIACPRTACAVAIQGPSAFSCANTVVCAFSFPANRWMGLFHNTAASVHQFHHWIIKWLLRDNPVYKVGLSWAGHSRHLLLILIDPWHLSTSDFSIAITHRASGSFWQHSSSLLCCFVKLRCDAFTVAFKMLPVI